MPVCYVAPGLTIYLAEAPDGAQAAAALEVYRAVCPAQKQRLVTGTRAPGFASLSDAPGRDLLLAHIDRMNRRRDQAIAVWDGAYRDSWYFTLGGVPSEHGQPRASFCKLTFPGNVDAEDIVRIAIKLSDVLPMRSGHAGWAAHFDADRKSDAFNRIFAWAKRYIGLEVEDLNVTLGYVLHAIKSVNWLTLVGDELWQKANKSGDVASRFGPDIELHRTKQGIVIQAGHGPVLGDRNAGVVPPLYGRVACALGHLVVEEHREFAGRFAEEGATMAYLRRFIDPEGWRW